MKKAVISIGLILLGCICFGENSEEIEFILDFSPRTWVTIYQDKMEFSYYELPDLSPKRTTIIDLSMENIDGMHFVDFYYPGGIFLERGQFVNEFSAGHVRWLILYCKELNYVTIHNADRETPVYDFSMEYTKRPSAVSYCATSTLVENGTVYDVNNLKSFNTGMLWVEGVNGFGIGEKIRIEYERYPGEVFHFLSISNGYVSHGNPTLYRKNSRVKKILISDNQSSYSEEFDIKDTPNYQIIELSKGVTDISVEILEVYEGDIWDDTCISVLVPVFPQL